MGHANALPCQCFQAAVACVTLGGRFGDPTRSNLESRRNRRNRQSHETFNDSFDNRQLVHDLGPCWYPLPAVGNCWYPYWYMILAQLPGGSWLSDEQSCNLRLAR